HPLVGGRFSPGYFSGGGCQSQIAISIDARLGSGNPALNLAKIGAPRKPKVIFEQSMVAIEDEIGARIHRAIVHLSVVRDVCDPSRGIVADKVVALSR